MILNIQIYKSKSLKYWFMEKEFKMGYFKNIKCILILFRVRLYNQKGEEKPNIQID
jgi:hypothetical protein